ncbi:DNA excision repair protein ERCC-6-like isoform X2 [Odontomachus brunneus]|nr:DNA excision repair protein ERCC-6-like isoform X2 [Odontomachus brunneus]
MKTENSILQEVSEHIKYTISSNKQSAVKVQETDVGLDMKNGEINSKNHKAELQKQVEIGEITPFEAIFKQSAFEQKEGTTNKGTQLLDLEKYFKQQTALAEHKRKLKEVLKKKDNIVSTKKLKLSDTKMCNKSHKSRCVKNTKDNFQQNINDTDSSNVVNDTLNNSSGSEYVPSDNEVESDADDETLSKGRKIPVKSGYTRIKKVQDDGNIQVFKERMETSSYPKDEAMHKLNNLFKVPKSIWNRLYRYQKVAVRWLWELHGRKLGGLLGDEMGLGKTVQIIAFFAGLDCSELLSHNGRFRGLGPTIIICPATLMEQWVKHFHEWWPFIRVVVLHQSSCYKGDPKNLIESLQTGGILITSYNGVVKHEDLIISSQWHYVILDEGHTIRNPQAKMSRAVKRLQTPHRLLLTGSPMQNSLKELWSLFDFILPGKLGTLSVFLEHCAAPIMRGGYTNATPLQEATALQVATMLKNTITPYMLRRTKTDVNHHLRLPEKNEQVLFCSLTNEQKKLYKEYLCSEDVSFILGEKNHHKSKRYKARFFIALSALRKICNHPDLFLYTKQFDSEEDIDLSEELLEKFGYWKRAGKTTVVRSLLKIWQKQGHRVLLFTQGKQMMYILESLLVREGYTYLKLDGATAMSQRQQMIQTFNNSPSYFIFLLTTRVGGLGLNLTGANRVIIYDPDWNPAIDAQARARAWRIGQNKQVTIYRLITAGTIEEKMYHRQIFKLLLSDKVLDEPRQRKLFKTSDLVELFNLNEPINGEASESDRLFKESKSVLASKFPLTKIEKMRKLASALSKKISAANIVKSTCNEDEKTSDHEHKHNGENNNLRCNEAHVVENHLSENQTLCSQPISVQESPSKDENLIAASNVRRNGNAKDNDISKDDSELNVALLNTAKDSVIEKEKTGSVLSDDKVESLHARKRKKSKKKKRENQISAMFEGERVSCLIGRRLGHSDEREKSVLTTDDDYVLRKLFAKSTVSSAFGHEAVLSNARYNSDNENTMQRFARESAQESMDYVRQSGRMCWRPA